MHLYVDEGVHAVLLSEAIDRPRLRGDDGIYRG